jgi:hypothetical protein
MTNLTTTAEQFDAVINICKGIFLKKNKDYGTAWRILRTSSLTDQIFIKAKRIRTLQHTKSSKVNEGINAEFIGIVNYAVMAIIQLMLNNESNLELDKEETSKLYDKVVAESKQLMLDKNHDYGEAWRDMRVSSLCDLILMKILRVKQIEDNDGVTLISEGLEANYFDMLNYAAFALIKLELETID